MAYLSQISNNSETAFKGAGGVTTDFQLLAQQIVPYVDHEFDAVVSRFLVDKKAIKYVSILMNFEFSYPPFPLGDWNVGRIDKCPHTGKAIFTHTELQILRGVSDVWHPTTVEYLELTIVDWVMSEGAVKDNVALVTHSLFENPVIMKIAPIPDDIGSMETETKAYRLIDGKDIGPKFLGHVTESGRVIGFLTESIEGAVEGSGETSDACFRALTQLHRLGISHGDLHPGNFLCQGDKVVMIDFEYANFEPTEKDKAIDIEMFDSWL